MITFARMKNKNVTVSLLFGLTLLFAIVIQSLHSFHHIEEVLVEKKCLHKSVKNKADIIHGHHKIEHCFVCEFTFNTSIKNDFYNFNFKKVSITFLNHSLFSKEITLFFKGSLFGLRAPPIV